MAVLKTIIGVILGVIFSLAADVALIFVAIAKNSGIASEAKADACEEKISRAMNWLGKKMY